MPAETGKEVMTTTANDRRLAILMYLCRVGSATRQELMDRFQVSKNTIDRDVIELSRHHPVDTVLGRAGGVVIEDGYYLGKQYLNEEQESLLRTLTAVAPDAKSRATLQSILDMFAHKGVKR